MRQFLFLFTFSMLSLFANSQNIKDTHTVYYSKNWQETSENNAYYTIEHTALLGAFSEIATKKKKNISYSVSFPLSWHEEVFDKQGNMISSGDFSGGYYDGKWARFYPNGQVKEITTYKSGEKTNYLSYYENGNFEFKDDKYYYETGELEKQEIDLSLELSAKIEYFTNGNVQKITYLRMDKIIADSSFIESGALLSRAEYENESKSLFEEFYTNGQISRSKIFDKDTAKTKIFSEEGSLLKEEVYYQSIKISEVILNNDNSAIPESTEEIFTIVEEMPAFAGCENLEIDERNQCTNQGIGNFIRDNYHFPPYALERNITGKEYIRFVIDAEGNVTDVQSASGTNSILTEFARRLISSFPKFTPGFQDGKNVPVQYIIPINYKIG